MWFFHFGFMKKVLRLMYIPDNMKGKISVRQYTILTDHLITEQFGRLVFKYVGISMGQVPYQKDPDDMQQL